MPPSSWRHTSEIFINFYRTTHATPQQTVFILDWVHQNVKTHYVWFDNLSLLLLRLNLKFKTYTNLKQLLNTTYEIKCETTHDNWSCEVRLQPCLLQWIIRELMKTIFWCRLVNHNFTVTIMQAVSSTSHTCWTTWLTTQYKITF
jgi:hypothetical protein